MNYNRNLILDGDGTIGKITGNKKASTTIDFSSFLCQNINEICSQILGKKRR